MDMMDNFEKNIKIMLKEKGLTQTQFAKLIGVGVSTVSDWLVKHKQPTLVNVYKITKELDCTFEELID